MKKFSSGLFDKRTHLAVGISSCSILPSRGRGGGSVGHRVRLWWDFGHVFDVFIPGQRTMIVTITLHRFTIVYSLNPWKAFGRRTRMRRCSPMPRRASSQMRISDFDRVASSASSAGAHRRDVAAL